MFQFILYYKHVTLIDMDLASLVYRNSLKSDSSLFFQYNSRKTWWIIVKHDWLGGDFQRHRCLMPISYQWNVGAWLLFVFESLLPRYIKSFRQSDLSELEVTFHIFKRGWNLWKIKRDCVVALPVRKVGNSARDAENLVAENSYWNSEKDIICQSWKIWFTRKRFRLSITIEKN